MKTKNLKKALENKPYCMVYNTEPKTQDIATWCEKCHEIDEFTISDMTKEPGDYWEQDCPACGYGFGYIITTGIDQQEQ